MRRPFNKVGAFLKFLLNSCGARALSLSLAHNLVDLIGLCGKAKWLTGQRLHAYVRVSVCVCLFGFVCLFCGIHCTVGQVAREFIIIIQRTHSCIM